MTEIVVYSTISPATQLQPVAWSLKARSGAWVRRMLDRARWRLRGDYSVNFNAWDRVRQSNRGDIAIREVIAAQLAGLAWPTPGRVDPVQWEQLTESHIRRLDTQGGVFVIAGGGYLFLDGDGTISPRVAADIALMRRMNCLRVSYGIGINQVRVEGNLRPITFSDLPDATLATLRAFCEANDVISVRDRSSQEVLAAVSAGSGRTIHLIGDPVLFLNEAAPPQRAPLRRGMLIGLNFALHGRNTAATLSARMRWIVPFLRRMHAEWDCRFHYFVHSETERILVGLLRQAGVPMEVVDGGTDALMRGYAKLDAHICQMMHSSIMAVSAWVPTLNIGYDVKNREFFSLLGVDRYCVDQADANEELLFERMSALLADPAGFVETVARHRAVLQQNLTAFQAEILARHRDPGRANHPPAALGCA